MSKIQKCAHPKCNNNAWNGISDYCEYHVCGNEAEPDEPCEHCHLPPSKCHGLTLKDACVRIAELEETRLHWDAAGIADAQKVCDLQAKLSRYEQLPVVTVDGFKVLVLPKEEII